MGQRMYFRGIFTILSFCILLANLMGNRDTHVTWVKFMLLHPVFSMEDWLFGFQP